MKSSAECLELMKAMAREVDRCAWSAHASPPSRGQSIRRGRENGATQDMKTNYKDIRDAIAREPLWFDENGTPRYQAFHPDLLPNIYAGEGALAVVACQACGHEFHVGVSYYKHDWLLGGTRVPTLSERIGDGWIGYGDPPNIGCCPAGPTMSSDEIRVVEYWSREGGGREWERNAAFEIPLADCEREGRESV